MNGISRAEGRKSVEHDGVGRPTSLERLGRKDLNLQSPDPESGERGDLVSTTGGGPASSAVTLSLEDRLYAAISRRGSLRIGQLLAGALDLCDGHGVKPTHPCAFYVLDEYLVSAVESYADSLEPS